MVLGKQGNFTNFSSELQRQGNKDSLLWAPSKLATTEWWFDASDEGTITSAGGQVSQWDDKSGNGNHVVQLTGSKQPITGTRNIGGALNALDFDGTDDDLVQSNPPTSVDYTVFGVIQVDTNAAVTDNSKGWMCFPDGGNPDIYFVARTHQDTIVFQAVDTDGDVDFTTCDTCARDTPHILCAQTHVAGGAAGFLRVDGTLESSTLTHDKDTQQAATQLAIGRQKPFATRYHEGLIGEVIICTSRLSVADIQKVEGYLAHKWNLVSKLPSGHPYKLTPPTV